jgi:acylphosphatase
MADSVIHRRVVVRGQVQGVFFRDSTREQARAAGVAGMARNLEDGAVEVILEGSPGAVERVLDFCRTGPRQAEVREVEVNEGDPQGLEGFEIA